MHKLSSGYVDSYSAIAIFDSDYRRTRVKPRAPAAAVTWPWALLTIINRDRCASGSPLHSGTDVGHSALHLCHVERL